MDQGTISASVGKTVLGEMFKTGRSAQEIVAQKGLTQISDAERLAPIIEEVVRTNQRAVADYLGGKEGALGFLVGRVMRATRGQANPHLVNQLLREHLEKLSEG